MRQGGTEVVCMLLHRISRRILRLLPVPQEPQEKECQIRRSWYHSQLGQGRSAHEYDVSGLEAFLRIHVKGCIAMPRALRGPALSGLPSFLLCLAGRGGVGQKGTRETYREQADLEE